MGKWQFDKDVQVEMTNNKQAVIDLLVNWPDAQKEIESLPGIYGMYYDLAFGVTPAIFVLYRTEDDQLLRRVRLERE